MAKTESRDEPDLVAVNRLVRGELGSGPVSTSMSSMHWLLCARRMPG